MSEALRHAPEPAATHEVTNQPPPLTDYNLFSTDRALRDAIEREGAGWAADELARFGATLGRSETIEAGFLANRYPPVLKTFDRYGHRRDEVEFHPAWHELMALGVAAGITSSPWADPRSGAHVARAGAHFMLGQIEAGVLCPLTMTYGAVPALRRQPELADVWLPKIYSRQYDSAFKPLGDKAGALLGMGMTEKQGGSDVRANTTRAEPVDGGGPAQPYRITGHKWFFSAPMCDGFLVLAYAPEGLSCFLMPRWTPDGQINAIRLQRLKDKLGNKANASSEVEFHGALGWLIGEEGRGVPMIIEMANYTRIDCCIGTAGLMRQVLAQALHHASYRTAFQRHLIDQPLMRNVLADLVVESEAATALIFRLARAYDRQDDPAETAFRRLLTPASKYWICKRGTNFAVEALEVHGGNGYVEESILPRIYREMPLGSIWEGSGNIMCLDMLRAAGRTPEGLQVFLGELAEVRGGDRRLDEFVDDLKRELTDLGELEVRARRLTERMVLALQGALLVRHGPPAVADAFCASRLDGDWGGAFGTLSRRADFAAIIDGARPQ